LKWLSKCPSDSVRVNELIDHLKKDNQIALPPRELNIGDIVVVKVRIYL
jgi:hypothetical protein